ncbi:hypothetical protein FHS04_000280 [Mesoflavibacter sabulilitoris]|uniref:3-methyl-2-oxobutanoate hydroxymethyltransferase n=1 Tax=Mesoflavibacter zeaxanthinifaciens subsp. sabulilitoris TaxID=1520893 RepID=A0A2T1NGZ1_9FLAO|nr:nuclear transport factor 2 family protein [Mesoflavibacter zeaxanthinifaciens]MBB3122792.1 hypothetical protein [Mesoflavibacter zeaxanthinifaciens subsp. sabulilitoris]PSG92126.1 3-methyl-2-oxobutanoate hydroxymethyltransferase [Mesoflavibacter zeaxanthinifaciens subsp. sabulilitoris]
MKSIFYVILLLISVETFAQSEAEVQKTIETFFEGFHKQDSTLLNQVVYKDVTLQTIVINREGKTILHTEDYSNFITSILSIPKNQKFKEKLLDFDIKIDGNMANAWTPYQFWFNDQFSHCGVNSFQLIKVDNAWKIFSLVDTRRKDCEE